MQLIIAELGIACVVFVTWLVSDAMRARREKQETVESVVYVLSKAWRIAEPPYVVVLWDPLWGDETTSEYWRSFQAGIQSYAEDHTTFRIFKAWRSTWKR